MANIYLTFDFGTDEEKIQQARHKLDNWKLTMRLDKKLLYKFDRAEANGADESGGEEPKQAEGTAHKGKATKGAKGRAAAKSKKESAEASSEENATGPTKLYLRLAFSNHEKLTEQRWLDRIPAEEPFKDASPETVRQGNTKYEEVESYFDELE